MCLTISTTEILTDLKTDLVVTNNNNNNMVCVMFVCVSLSVNVCMFTVSNALLMFNAAAIVREGGMSWLKPVATVLLMLCSAVFVGVFGFEPVLCCDVWYVLCYVWKNHLLKWFCSNV